MSASTSAGASFFLPAYALSGLWQLVHGRHWYRDNFFERQAYVVGAARRSVRDAHRV